MKNVLKTYFLFLIFTSATFSAAYYHIYDMKVSKQPLIIKYDKNNYRIHVFCMGQDLNFNGKFDDGDEKPSWWVLPQPGLFVPAMPTTDSVIRMKEFEMGSFNFPMRANFNIDVFMDNGSVTLSVKDTIKTYSLKNGSIINDFIGNYSTTDLLFDDNKYFLANSVFPNGEILIINGFSFLPLDTLHLNFKPNGLIKFNSEDSQYIGVLFEGNFGKSDSKVQFFKYQNEKWDSVKTLTLGAIGNHIISDSNYIYVSMNGSHEIKVIDKTSLEILVSLPTATTLYDGPREIVSKDNYIYVSTYAGDIRKYEISSWELKSIFEAPGKVEGFDFINDDYLITACPYEKDNYTPDSLVSFFSSLLDVRTEEIHHITSTFENNILNINSENLLTNVELFDINGKCIFHSIMINQNIYSVDLNDFNDGFYILKINTLNGQLVKKFCLIK